MTLEETHEFVGGHMDDILSCFKPGRKITVCVRSPESSEQDFLMTNDDLEAVKEMISRRQAKGVGQ